MRKRIMVAALVLGSVNLLWAGSELDYAQLSTTCEQLQTDPRNPDSLDLMLNAAQYEKSDKLRSSFMGVITLAGLLLGNDDKYTVCLKSLLNSYPRSVAAEVCARENFYSICKECNGVGKKTETTEINCPSCGNSGSCSSCGGSGRRPGLKGAGDLQCLTCRGSGRCPRCSICWVRVPSTDRFGRTYSQVVYKRERTTTIKCPVCNGVMPPVNTARLKESFLQLLQNTQNMCLQNSGVQQALAEVDNDMPLRAKVAILEKTMTNFSRAENIGDVREKLTFLKQSLLNEKMAQESQKIKEENLARTQKIAEEEQALSTKGLKEEQAQLHRRLLDSARSSSMLPVVIVHLRDFIRDNPESPVIDEAKLLLAEKEALAVEQNKAKTRNRNILIGGGLLAAIFLVSSCVRVKK